MKKLISALTLGAMVAGVAFADVSIALNYRQRAALASHKIEGGTGWFYADAYNGDGTDNLTINLGGDIVSFQTVIVGQETNESTLRTKTLRADVQLGKVGFWGGMISDGVVKGAYRNKTDVDAGNMEGVDFEYDKLGSGFKGSPSWFVDNIANGVQPNNDEPWAFGAKYTIRNFKAVKLELNGAYNMNTRRAGSGTTKASGSLQGHTGVGLIEASTEYGKGEFVFKYGQTAAQKDGDYLSGMAFGAYLQPTLIDNLTTTIGGAASVIDGDVTDYSFDLRLYYKMGDLSFTSFHKYSALNGADKFVEKGYKNAISGAASKGIADSGYADGKAGGTAITDDQLLSNNLMVRYKFSKSFAMYGVIADYIGLSGKTLDAAKSNKDGEDGGALVELRASLWGQFYAGSNSISIGVVYENYDVTEEYGDKVQNVTIPMIFRVKM